MIKIEPYFGLAYTEARPQQSQLCFLWFQRTNAVCNVRHLLARSQRIPGKHGFRCDGGTHEGGIWLFHYSLKVKIRRLDNQEEYKLLRSGYKNKVILSELFRHLHRRETLFKAPNDFVDFNILHQPAEISRILREKFQAGALRWPPLTRKGQRSCQRYANLTKRASSESCECLGVACTRGCFSLKINYGVDSLFFSSGSFSPFVSRVFPLYWPFLHKTIVVT